MGWKKDFWQILSKNFWQNNCWIIFDPRFWEKAMSEWILAKQFVNDFFFVWQNSFSRKTLVVQKQVTSISAPYLYLQRLFGQRKIFSFFAIWAPTWPFLAFTLGSWFTDHGPCLIHFDLQHGFMGPNLAAFWPPLDLFEPPLCHLKPCLCLFGPLTLCFGPETVFLGPNMIITTPYAVILSPNSVILGPNLTILELTLLGPYLTILSINLAFWALNLPF